MTTPDDWIADANGNRCSVSYFGSRKAAEKALQSLVGCKDCTNCEDCTDCNSCWYCSDCTGKSAPTEVAL